MKDYTEKNPVFSDTISITDTTDPGNANLLNEPIKQLLQNELVLNSRMNQYLGSDSKQGDSQNLTVTFDSDDAASADGWTDVAPMKSGEKHKSLFGKVSTMFKNVRYLYRLLGTTDISKIGSGTVTDIVKSLDEQKIGSIKTGTVETSAAGTSASVSVVKSGAEATINFKIPKGDTGAPGATGPVGPTGPAGPNKISNSAAITVIGEYALDASEKNAALPGTMAYELAQVNSKLDKQKIIKQISVSLEFTRNIYGAVSYCDYNFGRRVTVIGVNGVTGSSIWLPIGATDIDGEVVWRFTSTLITSEPYQHDFEILYVEL